MHRNDFEYFVQADWEGRQGITPGPSHDYTRLIVRETKAIHAQ